MEEQIKSKIAKIASELNTQKLVVRRTSKSESGDWDFSVETDVSNLTEEETTIAACIVALRVDEMVLRSAFSSGDISRERFVEELSSHRSGFSDTVAQLVGVLLRKRDV